jgi:hypothetical protein
MKIYKYSLRKIFGKPQSIQVPRLAKMLYCDYFNNQICIWFAINDANEPEELNFIVTLTGDVITYDSQYIGTVIDHVNKLVYHISEI